MFYHERTYTQFFYRVLHIYLPPFWWLAISKPVDSEKSYIPLWKAVTSGCLKKLLNWKQIYDEKLQMSFSKSGRTLFSSFNFEDSLFLSQLTQERVIYLFRKPWIVVHETSFEIGGKPVMEGSRRVLVKLLLLQLGGCGHPQDGATPSLFPDSKSSILGLSIDV